LTTPKAPPTCVYSESGPNDVILSSNHDFKPFAPPRKNLYRRLAINVNSQVNDFSTGQKAIRRRIGPSAGQIDSQRGSSPDNLIFDNACPGPQTLRPDRRDYGISQFLKSRCFGILPSGLFTITLHLRRKCGIMRLAYNSPFAIRPYGKLMACTRVNFCGMGKIQKVENAPFGILRKHGKRHGNIGTPLRFHTLNIRMPANPVRRKFLR
jgi:hypothetical protein